MRTSSFDNYFYCLILLHGWIMVVLRSNQSRIPASKMKLFTGSCRWARMFLAMGHADK